MDFKEIKTRISQYALNRYFWFGIAITAAIAFIVKEELVLGLIVGAAGLWFAAHDKQRFEIYKEKIRVYGQIQTNLAKLHHISFGNDRDLYNMAMQELVHACYQNLIFVKTEIFNDIVAICSITYELIDERHHEFRQLFNSISQQMRDDLDVDKLHGMTRTLHHMGDLAALDRVYQELHTERADSNK